MIASLLRRPLLAALVVLAALLLLLVGLETGFGTRLRPAVPAGSTKVAAATEAKLLPPPAATTAEQAYPETAARPLFVPTRRPAPVEPNAGKPAFTRGQYVLQGVIMVGEQRTALLREKASGKVHRVDRGQELNGITIEKVEPSTVTLAMSGEREKLDLVVQRATPGTTTTAGAAGGGTNPSEAPGPFGVSPVGRSPGGPTPAAPPQPGQGGQPAAVPGGFATPPAAAPSSPVQFGPTSANPNPQSTQPMSPEELLARRRARRNQTPTQ